jgi:hypothetical protein
VPFRRFDGIGDAVVLLYDGEHAIEIALCYLLLGEDLFYVCLVLFAGVPENVDEGEGHLAFLQIGPHVLAQHIVVRCVVEDVIHELKGYAEIVSEIPQCPSLTIWSPAEDGSYLAGGSEKNGRLVADYLVVILFGRFHVGGLYYLEDLALGQRRRHLRDRFQDLVIAVA